MIIAETKRLLISKMTINDAPFYLELVNTPNWLKFIGERGVSTIEEAEKRIEETIISSYETHNFGAYKLMLKDDNLKTIGSCGLYKRDQFKHPDIGFAMLEDYEAKGFGYESSVEIMKFAEHNLKCSKILAITLAANKPSIKLLEKLGLTYEKTVILFDDNEELLLFSKNLVNPV